jgi:hypothetical protein
MIRQDSTGVAVNDLHFTVMYQVVPILVIKMKGTQCLLNQRFSSPLVLPQITQVAATLLQSRISRPCEIHFPEPVSKLEITVVV